MSNYRHQGGNAKRILKKVNHKKIALTCDIISYHTEFGSICPNEIVASSLQNSPLNGVKEVG